MSNIQADEALQDVPNEEALKKSLRSAIRHDMPIPGLRKMAGRKMNAPQIESEWKTAVQEEVNKEQNARGMLPSASFAFLVRLFSLSLPPFFPFSFFSWFFFGGADPHPGRGVQCGQSARGGRGGRGSWRGASGDNPSDASLASQQDFGSIARYAYQLSEERFVCFYSDPAMGSLAYKGLIKQPSYEPSPFMASVMSAARSSPRGSQRGSGSGSGSGSPRGNLSGGRAAGSARDSTAKNIGSAGSGIPLGRALQRFGSRPIPRQKTNTKTGNSEEWVITDNPSVYRDDPTSTSYTLPPKSSSSSGSGGSSGRRKHA